LAAYPRDKVATMESDWQWVLRVLRQMQDQALDGVPLRLEHPRWLPQQADVISMYRSHVAHMIEDIFLNAVADEPKPEPPNANAS
jgi:hypothetical protein